VAFGLALVVCPTASWAELAGPCLVSPASAGRVALAGHPGARVLGLARLCSVFCRTAGPEPPAVLLRLDYRPPAHPIADSFASRSVAAVVDVEKHA
jgi:hypothetical protein